MSDPMCTAGQGLPALGARSGKGAADFANSENVAPVLNGASISWQPAQKGCFAPSTQTHSSSGPGSSTSSTAASSVACTAPMPSAGVLGDITSIVHASSALGGTVRNDSSFLQPQPQPSLGAVPLPAPAAAQVAAPPLRLAPPLSLEPFCSVFDSDAQDPQRASEYAGNIYSRLLESESLCLPKPDYMEGQADINAKMRAILVDWLAEVHMKYKMRSETLYLTVNIIDRYLSVRPVMRRKLQLLGVVAMFIGAKYEEIDPPKVHEFAYITDHTYSKKEIVAMECTVLAALQYQIAVPTPAHFLDRLLRANACDAVHRSLVQYILELSLLQSRFLAQPPSLLVSAAILMSNDFLGRRRVWPAAMIHHSRRSEASLRACAADLRALHESSGTATLQAVRRKFRLDLHHGVANLSPCIPRG